MPQISFSFSGYVNGAIIEKAIDVATGNEVDVSAMTSEELVQKIKAGELAISLTEALANNEDDEVEIFDEAATDEAATDEAATDEAATE